MNPETQTRHHESGKACISNDASLILNITENNDNSPFSVANSDLINIANGQIANKDVKSDLTTVNDIGVKALQETIQSNKSEDCCKTEHIPYLELERQEA